MALRFLKQLFFKHTKTIEMQLNTPVSAVLVTNCTIVEAGADIQTIRFIFSHFPNRFLPVVQGIKFVGIITREDFFKSHADDSLSMLSAKDLISKEIVKLATYNSIWQAKEVFDTGVFDVIPVTDETGDLMGVVLKEDVESAYTQTSQAFKNAIQSARSNFSA